MASRTVKGGPTKKKKKKGFELFLLLQRGLAWMEAQFSQFLKLATTEASKLVKTPTFDYVALAVLSYVALSVLFSFVSCTPSPLSSLSFFFPSYATTRSRLDHLPPPR